MQLTPKKVARFDELARSRRCEQRVIDVGLVVNDADNNTAPPCRGSPVWGVEKVGRCYDVPESFNNSKR
jgi:hypothetical protein